MDIRLIKVYESDYDYNYENYFLVKDNEESLKKLCELEEEIQDLDYFEKEEKYGSESNIEIIEWFIVNNFEKVDYYRSDIEC